MTRHLVDYLRPNERTALKREVSARIALARDAAAMCKASPMAERAIFRAVLGLDQDVPGEEWRTIPSFPEYQASSEGRIRRCLTKTGRPSADITRLSLRGEYLCFTPSKGGKWKSVNAHRCVAEAFLGPANGRHVNHKNGNKMDNHFNNLEWVTPSENFRHALRPGLAAPAHGSAHWNSKLTEESVRAIRQAAAQGTPHVVLAERYEIAPSSISAIVRRMAWRNVE